MPSEAVSGAPGSSGSNRPAIIPALPRPAWVVLGGDFLSAIGTGLTLPYLFIYAHAVRHASYSSAGLIVATIALASLVGNPLGGAMADRWTARRALIAGLFISAAGAAALAFAASAAALFGAAAVVGLGASIIWPAQDALLASLVSPGTRSAVFSVRYASMNAGLSIGTLSAAIIVSVAHPATFTAIYLADACSFLAVVPVLMCLRIPAPTQTTESAAPARPAAISPPRFREILRDKAFLRVWALTALIVAVSYGQYSSSFAGYATRPGGVSTHAIAVAFAANTVTVVIAQLFVLRWLRGRRRTTGASLAAAAWAICWVVVIVGGHLGAGLMAELAFVTAMVVFALGETLLSPTVSAIINDLAPQGAAGRYNGAGVLAFTTGFLVGPALGGAALGAGLGSGLFALIAMACVAASVLALRLARYLPSAANWISPHDPDPGDNASEEGAGQDIGVAATMQ